jgi:hypothetical protein
MKGRVGEYTAKKKAKGRVKLSEGSELKRVTR